jgi:hypothetical protein
MDTQALPITVSVTVFARIALSITSENAAYDAAKRGDFPTFKVGPKIMRVPVRAALRQLAGGDQAILENLAADFLQKLQKTDMEIAALRARRTARRAERTAIAEKAAGAAA